ncbi:MAG: CHAP domain-containing protein [Candidatus Paceibacterota bacterium]|jgi:surface antigen
MNLDHIKGNWIQSIGNFLVMLLLTFVLMACGTGSGTAPEPAASGIGSASEPAFSINEAASGSVNAFATEQRVMALLGGANVRNDALTSVRFTQNGGVHGTLVGNPVNGTAGGFTGNWWKIQWDSEPPNQNGTQGWTAESKIVLAPSAGDVPKPNLSSHYYTTDNHYFFPSLAPDSIGGSVGALGNCTWYVQGRLRELGYKSTELDALVGNAGDWANQAIMAGLSVDNNPTVGSIAQVNRGSFSSVGHVAVVESLNADGTITVTESSYTTDANSVWNFLWHHRTVSRADLSWPSNFIHIVGAD